MCCIASFVGRPREKEELDCHGAGQSVEVETAVPFRPSRQESGCFFSRRETIRVASGQSTQALLLSSGCEGHTVEVAVFGNGWTLGLESVKNETEGRGWSLESTLVLLSMKPGSSVTV